VIWLAIAGNQSHPDAQDAMLAVGTTTEPADTGGRLRAIGVSALARMKGSHLTGGRC
jgi:hypothetical protein